ncbi:MAG: hypothetical protein IJT96_05925 [Lachnospiraceae bacterium]|nr:hypothetical protein [Lachnospiraceae bacterium]
MKIWAHRGCSQRYPENTIIAFSKAAELFDKGLEGIELDVQLTKDGEMVVMHDERIDRTTDGYGFVRDYTFDELKTFHIHTGNTAAEHIPTFKEVLDLLKDRMYKGFRLNIELKNSVYPYPGMEERVHDIVEEYGLHDKVVYSSFSAKSLEIMRSIDSKAEIGMLDTKVSDCLYKLKGGCGADALHPYWQGMDLPREEFEGYTVRAWLSGHLYPEKPTGGRLDLQALEEKGITDVFLNEPEVYL